MTEPRTIVSIRNNSKFTKEVVTRFYEAIRYGSKIKQACEYAGISPTQYYTWRRRANKKEEPYYTFVLGVEQAQGEFVVRNLQAVHAHTAIDWKAAAWLLERRHPQDFAMRQFIEEEPPLLRDLKELVGGGLVTIAEIREEMPDLPKDYLNILMAMEAQMLSSVSEVDGVPIESNANIIEGEVLPAALQMKLSETRSSGDSNDSPVLPAGGDS